MASPQERLISWFESQIGYVPTYGKYNKFAEYLDSLGYYNTPKNGYDWCDITYDCGMVQTFGESLALRMTFATKGGGGAGCWISAQDYRDHGHWSDSPQLAAQIFFGPLYDERHTGCVVGLDDYNVYTIEGNTGYGQGYTGGAVLPHTYDRNDPNIAGYGIPDWSLVEEEVTEEDKRDIARYCAEYCFGDEDKARNLNMYNQSRWTFTYLELIKPVVDAIKATTDAIKVVVDKISEKLDRIIDKLAA